MPRSKSFCASGLHDVSKCTLPNLLSSVCPRADRASETPVTAMAATASDVLFMILLLVGFEPNSARSSLGLKERAGLPDVPDPQSLRVDDTLRWRSGCGACHTHTRFPAVGVEVLYRQDRPIFTVIGRSQGPGRPRRAPVALHLSS